jgi:Tfp pilus assembly protein PilV
MRTIFHPQRHNSARGEHRRARLGREDGFTLFEALIAAVVLVVGLTALLGMLTTAIKASAATKAREGAVSLARQILEDARTVPYAQIAPSSIAGELQAMTGLANISSGSTWQVARSGTTYTITVTACSIDDPKNGYGIHDSTFCADSTIESTAANRDPQPANLKRITVDVRWPALNRAPDVHQVETLTAAGEAVGLTASKLELTSPAVAAPTAPVIITEPLANALTFTVTGPTGTVAMSWSLEGVRQTSTPTLAKGAEWTFSWPIGETSDGTYQISAQAINAAGVYGPPVSISVTLIRRIPAAPKNVQAGFNTVLVSGVSTKVAELKWQANSERNVIGYRVYNPSSQLVCPASEVTLSLAVSCIDFHPPEPTASNLAYSVVALYRKAEGEALSKVEFPGTVATFTLVGGPPPAPQPPTSLKVTKNAEGSVTLKWSAPSSGVAVSFYRIYRGSTDYTGRYGVAPAGTTEFTDADAVTTHSYWVTAVSANMTESPFLGPESG